MLVKFVTIQVSSQAVAHTIEKLKEALGPKIPEPMALEGGDMKGPLYLFCFDAEANVDAACENFECKVYDTSRKIEVDANKFNSDFCTSISYGGESYYVLEKK